MSKKSVTAPIASCFQFGQPPHLARAWRNQNTENATVTAASTTKSAVFACIAPILTPIRAGGCDLHQNPQRVPNLPRRARPGKARAPPTRFTSLGVDGADDVGGDDPARPGRAVGEAGVRRRVADLTGKLAGAEHGLAAVVGDVAAGD